MPDQFLPRPPRWGCPQMATNNGFTAQKAVAFNGKWLRLTGYGERRVAGSRAAPCAARRKCCRAPSVSEGGQREPLADARGSDLKTEALDQFKLSEQREPLADARGSDEGYPLAIRPQPSRKTAPPAATDEGFRGCRRRGDGAYPREGTGLMA